MEMWRRHFPFYPFKWGATGSEVPFHHRCRSRQILGCEGFWPNFPKLALKVYCATFAYKFSPTKIMKTSFWCNLQKRSSCVFIKTLGAIFWSQTTLGAFFTRTFRASAQIFSKSKLLVVRLQPLQPSTVLFLPVPYRAVARKFSVRASRLFRGFYILKFDKNSTDL